MCVKITTNNIEKHFDCDIPIESQVSNASSVKVEYRPDDKEICKFLQEIDKCAKNGISLKINVKVDYNNYLEGFKFKKQINKAVKSININELIKLMVLSQSAADKKLKELVDMCLNRECDVK